MFHYTTLFNRLKSSQPKPDPQSEILKQAALVKELENKASEERMRLAMMLLSGKAA